MNDMIRRTVTHEDFWRKVCTVVLVCFLIAFLVLAMLQPANPYGESGSTLLPAVSLSNHGSFRITEQDLEEACSLFPGHAESLRTYYYNFLPETFKEGRYPFYLGAYAPLCIPVLSALRLLHLDAVYAFSITNALLLSLALWVVYRFAKIGEKQKLLAILLLGTSPILRYINVQLYETTLFSCVVIAMVFWLNRSRKLAALFLAIAGTMNPTIMAFGIFMILDYFFEMFADGKWSGRAFLHSFSANWKKTAGLAVCFLPCFIPFVISYFGAGYLNSTASLGQVTPHGMGGRFCAYLFDLNFGLFPYYPVLLFLFAIVAVWGSIRKNYNMLFTLVGCLAVIGAYSLTFHINCGMTGLARYNAWLVPIIVLSVVYYAPVVFTGQRLRRFGSGLLALSCVWCVFIVGITAYSPEGGNYVWWTPVAETVMEYVPGLYDPLPSTFRSRTEHVDGGYDITEPIVYLNSDCYVRKVLVPPGMLDQAVQQLAVPAEDQAVFEKQCAKVKRTDKYYYLNFPSGTHIRKSVPYELGQTVGFGTESPEAHKYVINGVSGPESGFAWTNGPEMVLSFDLNDAPEKDVQMRLNLLDVYTPPQRMTVSAAGTILLDTALENNGPQSILITIPEELFDGPVAVLTFELPDAISPVALGQNNDARNLALAISDFSITYVDQPANDQD